MKSSWRDVQGMYKGCTRDVQGIPKGTTLCQHRRNTVVIPWQFGVPKTLEGRWGCGVSGKAIQIDGLAGVGPPARLAHEASKARDVLELNKAKARHWFSKPISSWKSGKVALARLGACPRQCMKRLTPRRRNMAKIQTALRWRTRLRSSWALTSRR